MSVAPEVVREPEIEMRPEPEIATCEKGLGATRSYPTDAASLLTLAEIVTAHANKEVTETTLISAAAPYQTPTAPSPFHTGSHRVIISAGMSATSADISRADILPPQLSYYGDMPIAGSFAPARAPICDTTVVPLSA